jgi:hypothetical protein
VNNNYHLELDIKLAKQLKEYELGLIQVPYSLDIILEHPLFKKIICFNYRMHSSLKKLILKPSDIIKIKKNIDEKILIEKIDILLVHTEIDLINQYIIQKFYENQARVFLLEDGTSTMGTYNLPPLKGNFIDGIKTFLLQKIYHFKYTSIVKLGNQTLPMMSDFVFKGSIVNYGNNIRRKIPLFTLKQKKESLELKYNTGALFLSQGLYSWHVSEDNYIKFIDSILTISSNFSPFYFKYHPSEKNSVKETINLLIKNKYPNILIVEENIIAEKIIGTLQVKYVITVNSSAALNLINKGVIPIFLNDLFYNDYPSDEGRVFSSFLNSINCNIPQTITEIKPDFIVFNNNIVSDNSYSISEILNF